jgi:hypothetical protein
MARPTDLEVAGLATEPAQVRGRHWLLTVDLEAFNAERIDPWVAAIRRLAQRTRALSLRFEIFLSVEHVVRLRHASPAAHDEFLGALRELGEAGAAFYPHNHCLFDPETGHRPGADSGFPHHVDGYLKRASMFYDVVYRNRVDFSEWMRTLTEVYLGILAAAGLPDPARRAFRPGGWDHGSTPDDLRQYVHALQVSGYGIDSSATAGAFGTPSWRVCSPFGANAFWLAGGLLELAPTSSLDWGQGQLRGENGGALVEMARQPRLWASRQPGAMVTVLHLNQLFDLRVRGRRQPVGVYDPSVIRRRMDRTMGMLKRLEGVLGMRASGFEDVEVAAPARPPGPAASAL